MGVNETAMKAQAKMLLSKATPRSSPNKVDKRDHMLLQEDVDEDYNGNVSSGVEMYAPSVMEDCRRTTLQNYRTPKRANVASNGNLRPSFSAASPILSCSDTGRYQSNFGGTGRTSNKRKSVEVGRVENKRFIREIANGMDKMAIQVMSPPPSPELEKNWMNQFYANAKTLAAPYPIEQQTLQRNAYGDSKTPSPPPFGGNKALTATKHRHNLQHRGSQNDRGKTVFRLRHVSAIPQAPNVLAPGALVNRKLFFQQQPRSGNRKCLASKFGGSKSRFSTNYQADEEDSDNPNISLSKNVQNGMGKYVPKRIVQLRDEDTIFRTMYEHDMKCRNVLNSISKIE